MFALHADLSYVCRRCCCRALAALAASQRVWCVADLHSPSTAPCQQHRRLPNEQASAAATASLSCMVVTQLTRWLNNNKLQYPT